MVAMSASPGTATATAAGSTDSAVGEVPFTATFDDAAEDSVGLGVRSLHSVPARFGAVTETAILIQTIDTSLFTPPSPDPAGVVWSDSIDRLLISDSEVNEYPYFTGENLFAVRRSGEVTATGSSQTWTSNEPTGIALDDAGGRFFATDDNRDKIWVITIGADGIPGTVDDTELAEIDSEAFGAADIEGITFDTTRGWLHAVNEETDQVFSIDPGPNGVFDDGGDDVISTFSTAAGGVDTPEGIAYNATSDRLAVVDRARDIITEFSVTGEHLRDIDISAAATVTAAGATWGDSSDGTGTSLWVVDRGKDGESPIDGRLLEFRVPSAPAVRVTPSPARFGPTGPEVQTLTVANIGTETLTVDSEKVTGHPGFSLVSTPAAYVLAPGESVEVDVRYDGVVPGANVAHLEVVSPDPEVGTYSAPLVSVYCPAGGTPFTDLSDDSFAFTDIACIYNLDVTTGTTTTTYSPGNYVTREQMGAFLARLWLVLGNDCPEGPNPFIDLPVNSFAYLDILCIYHLGITTGTSANTYSPDSYVTREQMGAFLARLWRELGVDCPLGGNPFTDVSQGSFAFADIACIFHLEVTTGTTPITYSPSNYVTREQMGAFLARLYRTYGVGV